MTTSKIAQAFPRGTVADDVVRATVADATPLVLHDPHEIDDLDFQAANAVAVPWVITCNGVDFIRYPAGDGGLSDYVATLVAVSGECYRAELSERMFVNVLGIVDAPPGGAAVGDAYIASAAPSGDFAGDANKLMLLTNHGWEGTLPEIGFSTYVIGAGRYYYAEDGSWQPGQGPLSIAAGSVGARELAFPWGMVVESVTDAPPGTRATGGTPTTPLGGTPANIADDDTATVSVTGALGNLSAASPAGRVIAKYDAGAVVDVAGLQAAQLKASSGASSSAGAMSFYTSADDVTLTAYGAGFTLSDVATDFARAGNVSARYFYVVTEAKDWGAATHTIGDFNVYLQATGAADGSKFIVAANGLGAAAGQDSKIGEAQGGAYTFYAPYDGAVVLNKATKTLLRWDAAAPAWVSVSGAALGRARSAETVSGSTTSLGTGSVTYTYSAGTAPTTGKFGLKDNVGATYKAHAAGNVLRFSYEATIDITSGSAGGSPQTSNQPFVLALFADAGAAAVAWRPIGPYTMAAGPRNLSLQYAAPDDDNHTYYMAIMAATQEAGGSDIDWYASALSYRVLDVVEYGQ